MVYSTYATRSTGVQPVPAEIYVSPVYTFMPRPRREDDIQEVISLINGLEELFKIKLVFPNHLLPPKSHRRRQKKRKI